MSLVGNDNVAWDDFPTCVRLDSKSAAKLPCGPSSIAVGMISGGMTLYNHQIFQKEQVLDHWSYDNRLHFDRTGKLLISSSTSRLAAWDTQGSLKWKREMGRSLVMLDSSESAIVGFTPHGHLLSWDTQTGILLGDETYAHRTPDSEMGRARRRAASMAAISPGMDMLAIAYMAQPVCLWLRETNGFIGWVIDDRGGHPVTVIFNPNPEVSMLLVAYRDCQLELFHSYSGAHIHISALALSDDNLIASGDTFGNVFVYKLDASSSAVKVGPVNLRVKLNKSIRKVILVPGSLLLVATADCDRMFSLESCVCTGELKGQQDRGHVQWALGYGVERGLRLFCIENQIPKEFDVGRSPARVWEDIRLEYDVGKGVEETTVTLATMHDNVLVMDTRRTQGHAVTSWPLLFDLGKVEKTESGSAVAPMPLASRLASKVRCMVVPRPDLHSHDRLLFFSGGNWLCGVVLAEREVGPYVRHFLVPNEFSAQAGGDEVLPVRTIDGDVVFSVRGEPAVVKGG